jgi:hypothetical protein
MSKKLYLLACILLIVAFPGIAAAQSASALPKVIWISREEVKPAKINVHERIEQGFARQNAKAKVLPYLALEAISGNATEAMFISGYDSFAQFDNDFQAFSNAPNGPARAEYEALNRQEAEVVSGVQSWVAVCRPDLSYRADHFMEALAKSRYFEIETFRVRMGKDDDFANASHLFQKAFEKIKSEQPYVFYQVMMGTPGGAYLLFTPMKSLKQIDDEMANEKAFAEAFGVENLQKLEKSGGDVFTVPIRQDIYAINPQMSNVSKEFAAADPKYWTPKPPPVPRRVVKKEPESPKTQP